MVGFTLVPTDLEDDRQSVHSVDRHSIASTVATTTSLASRIRDLNLFEAAEDKEAEDGKDADRVAHSPLPEGSEEEREDPQCAAEDGESGRAGALSEEDLTISHTLHHLLQRDPPLQVCCRLFERRSHPPLPLKRMSMVQVEDFRQHGYVVIDNFISKDAAARIKAEALRLSQRGLMQPVSVSSMGVLSLAAGSLGLLPPGLGSSPCSTCSSHSQHAGACSSAVLQGSNGCSSSTPQQLHQQLQQLQQQPGSQQQQQQRWGELRMPLVLGHPPADTAVFAPVMAALQELQEDLSEFVRLRSKGAAEYCLCQLPSGSLPVPRHRDALPDDGRSTGSVQTQQPAAAPSSLATARQHQQQQLFNGLPAEGHIVNEPNGCTAAAAAAGDLPLAQQQAAQLQPMQAVRRVSVFVFVNADWEREGGGGLRLWPPQRGPVGPPSATAASAAARRSPTSSDAGTTFSEISDCGSLRMPIMGSTTSSVIAEASAPDHDTYSLDGISLAESEAERPGFEWVECEGGEMALDIAPLAGRVLVVLSGAVEHALLPSSGLGPSDMMFVRAWCS